MKLWGIRRLFRHVSRTRGDVRSDIADEFSFHLDMRTDELIRAGLTRESARRQAEREFGPIDRGARMLATLGDRVEQRRRAGRFLAEIWQDAAHGVRLARRNPGFAAVAILTLALGIGINTAIFSLADAALMRPLPFRQPDRLVMISERRPTGSMNGVSPLNLRDWRAQSRSFEDFAHIGRGMGGGPLLMAPDGSVEPTERQGASANLFDVLGVTPIVGRTFRPEDDGPSPNVVLLGEAVWRRRFGADPSIVGRLVRLSGRSFTVVGVVTDNLQMRRPAAIWTLTGEVPDVPVMRAGRAFEAVARLKAGVTIETAQAEMTAIADRLAREYPEANKDVGVIVEPIRDGIVGANLQTTSLFLLGVVGVVLLLCCANVANLLLARTSVRVKELAVRSAIGAGRARIARQLLIESLVLAVSGGLLGVAAGAAILEFAPALIPPGLLPAAVTPSFDLRVAAFGLIAAVAVGVVFGVVPAWQATGRSLSAAITSESRSATSGSRRLRHMLVSAEVAAAVLLLCGAGLLLQTLLTLAGSETGYRSPSESVLTLDFSVGTGEGSRHPTSDAVNLFYDGVARDVKALPEVRRVGWASSLPYGQSELGHWAFEIAGDRPREPRNRPTAEFTTADPGYFETLDVPIVSGRGFSERDTLGSMPVCLVNEAFVRRHFKGRDPIGVRLTLTRLPDGQLAQVREIVGVARQTIGEPDDADELVQVYVPLAQFPTGDVFMVVQPSAGVAEALTPLIRRVVARHDPDVPVRRDRTLETLSIQSTAGYRFRATMVGAFALLALVLAMVGVFGVLAYAVQHRQREIGVRIALGATSRRVVWLVVREAGVMVAAGATVGVVLAGLFGRMLSTFLYGVDALDPLNFVVVLAVLLLTAALAAAAPAWRASRVNPVVAFRQDG
jgi:putative ABC transport system permease protein